MKLFGSTKNLKDKTKNAENVESWSNQYQQKCEVLNTFNQINLMLICWILNQVIQCLMSLMNLS